MKQEFDVALDQLETDLKEAIGYRSTDSRTAAGTALRAIVTFLGTQPRFIAQNLHRPFYDLLQALADLDDGQVAPLLSPVRFPNRHPDPIWLREMRGHVIFAIEQLVARGEIVTRSCERVAKIWNEVTGEIRESSAIKSWYDRRNRLSEDDHTFYVLAVLRAARDAAVPPDFTSPNPDLTLAALAETLKSQTADEVLQQLTNNLTSLKSGRP